MQTKKIYVSPSIEVTELEVMESILALSVEDEITADPNEEVRISYFAEFYGIPEDVEIIFESSAE